MSEGVDSGLFYETYHGHEVKYLKEVHQLLVEDVGCKRFIWLAGDSSMDNKHWFFNSGTKVEQMNNDDFTAEACNGWDKVLSPPRMVQDISYWLNKQAADQFGDGKVCCLNTAVEESTVKDREGKKFTPQDKVIVENMRDGDYLVISVGGNDVALRPTQETMIALAKLLQSPPEDIAAGRGEAFDFFVDLFHTQVEAYIKRLCASATPKKVLVCTIYYPCTSGSSWADQTLDQLGYNENPALLQTIVSLIFKKISAKGFNVSGTEVIPIPLFEVLDCNDQKDYKQRVEPSVQGGRKMAAAFLDALDISAEDFGDDECNDQYEPVLGEVSCGEQNGGAKKKKKKKTTGNGDDDSGCSLL